MPLEHLIEKIQETCNSWDLSRIKTLFDEKRKLLEENQTFLSQNNLNAKNEILKLTKEQEKLDCEIEILKAECNKKNMGSSSLRTETTVLTKHIYELENEITKYEDVLNEKRRILFELEKEVKKLSNPSCEYLFNCFIKGINIEFIERENKLFACSKILNTNELNEVEIDENDLDKVRELLWQMIQ
ncbi:hypothetical protein EHP00_628 [Ecytonucleospora hepatopenaei]|uniref:Kinetochore protein Spc24 n=1 Tax=Ecytonucleospora hepatopenaei TaxID=646526 RepID=A0A1W0E2N3_9MICR|nr:hypothetical protein EHP00_628 [Ecytonucleospora hepatopenaei]